METKFVNKNSIVTKIWGKADTVLFIFAGAAAEFALNKAVDWLYFTGKLPADPLERLFSTVSYAREIIFSDEEAALQAIDRITAIHKGVEKSRGAQIPDWAYRDVLFLLIDYSIRSFELLERNLTIGEKTEVFEVFNRVGQRMGLADLPTNYPDWMVMREQHLRDNLICSEFTADLYRQYKKHLGKLRYFVLKQVQLLLTPTKVSKLVLPAEKSWLWPALFGYKMLRFLKIAGPFKNVLLPGQYKTRINDLNVN